MSVVEEREASAPRVSKREASPPAAVVVGLDLPSDEGPPLLTTVLVKTSSGLTAVVVVELARGLLKVGRGLRGEEEVEEGGRPLGWVVFDIGKGRRGGSRRGKGTGRIVPFSSPDSKKSLSRSWIRHARDGSHCMRSY